MSSKKNRDLAQELVDFLQKDEEQKTKVLEQTSEKKAIPKPALVVPPIPPVPPVKQLPVDKGEQETYVIDNSTVATPTSLKEPPKKDVRAETIDFSIPFSDQGTLAVKNFGAPGEITQKTGEPPAGLNVNLTEEKAKSTGLAPSSAPDLFSTQRSKIIFNEVASLMAGVEAVKVAQARINVLEKEKSKLRDEIDELLLASESLQRQLNELRAEHDALERRHREKIEILEDEKAVLRTRSNAKEDELTKYKKENEDLKMRFQTDLRKVRVRERELETRQEIMKSENVSVMRAKDDLIVELKRQLEKLHFELDNFRAQSADLNSKVGEFHDRNHRTVKALRLALSVLEAGDGDEKKKSS